MRVKSSPRPEKTIIEEAEAVMVDGENMRMRSSLERERPISQVPGLNAGGTEIPCDHAALKGGISKCSKDPPSRELPSAH